MVLSGTYADMRDVHLPARDAPEFVVIDNVELAEGDDRGTGRWSSRWSCRPTTGMRRRDGVESAEAAGLVSACWSSALRRGMTMARRDDSPAGTQPRRPIACRGRRDAAAGSAGRRDAGGGRASWNCCKAPRAELAEPERNLFRFQAQARASAAAPRHGRAAAPRAPMADRRRRCPGRRRRRRFRCGSSGCVDAATQAGRIAILSDGRGNVFYGKEGDIIEDGTRC